MSYGQKTEIEMEEWPDFEIFPFARGIFTSRAKFSTP